MDKIKFIFFIFLNPEYRRLRRSPILDRSEVSQKGTEEPLRFASGPKPGDKYYKIISNKYEFFYLIK